MLHCHLALKQLRSMRVCEERKAAMTGSFVLSFLSADGLSHIVSLLAQIPTVTPGKYYQEPPRHTCPARCLHSGGHSLQPRLGDSEMALRGVEGAVVNV